MSDKLETLNTEVVALRAILKLTIGAMIGMEGFNKERFKTLLKVLHSTVVDDLADSFDPKVSKETRTAIFKTIREYQNFVDKL